MWTKKHTLVKNVYKWAKLFKEDQNRIQDTNRTPIVNTPEIVDSVTVLILAYKEVTIEDISEQFGISEGTAHKNVCNDLTFFKVGCHWISKMLPLENTQGRAQLSLLCFIRFANDVEDLKNYLIWWKMEFATTILSWKYNP